MTTLNIVTLAEPRESVLPGSHRYFLPGPSEHSEDQGYVIVLEPVQADRLLDTGPDSYGAVRVITPAGVRVVSTLGLGVLVVDDSSVI